MKRAFALQKVGRFRRSAARGMAKAGFAAAVIAIVLRLKRSTDDDIVAGRQAPGALWSAAERALFKEVA
ncbi:hypothetical protein FQV39_28650 [Bosea sp. F3-2]|uniref:hypothetical protein n=1 Tax=Bosea sp. F3-2 TaxID=2599640 RepID=UPI0011EE35F9|nr:hypothetical protein [Bosea sp. F3-2]QEL26135.1 hypothetical protein FQV39_28650 [Bosea sp. F3-2]